MKSSVQLIVNADDYGYFPTVSRGILDCAHEGIVTATGVIATGTTFERQVEHLLGAEALDVGVHLSLTIGQPLTGAMAEVLGGGGFPGKFAMTAALIKGRIDPELVMEEWRAQIQRCADAGLKLSFLNSHEHLHMFPALYPRCVELARESGITYLRFTAPEWRPWAGSGGVFRNLMLGAMNTLNLARVGTRGPVLIGTAVSGKLRPSYLRQVLPRLKAGKVYELMCHPGRAAGPEVVEGRLLDYHDWEGERRVLMSTQTRRLCEEHGIQLTRFSALRPDGAQSANMGRTPS